MNVSTFARYATVAAIIAVVGGIFVVRDVLPGAEADTTDALGVASAAGKPELGAEAPDFVLEAPGTGELVHLSDYRGQTVVLNFWATWCTPCRTEMPDLQAAHADDPDLVVLAVNAQETDPAVTRFIEDFGLTFPVVLDRNGAVREHYGVIGLPATFFIDAEGILRGRNFGPVYGDLLAQGIATTRRDAAR